MAVASEVQSLNEINYKPKLKVFLLIILGFMLFLSAFVNFYPIGDKLKAQIKTHFKATPGCNPDFDQIRMEFFMPKIVVSDLVLPASCLGRTGEALKFSFVTLNYHLINFSPFGLPFRLDTEFSGQPLSIHYVLGINEQMIRLKDQSLVLSRLQTLIGNDVKLAGSVKLDLNLMMSKNIIKNLSFKAVSNDFQVPSQSIQNYTVPNLKLNKFFVDASSESHPRINIDQLVIGDAEAPVRANFKGKVDPQEGNMAFSPLNLVGEVAFSESFKAAVPLLDLVLNSFTQKDGFYQIRLGGTLGAPQPSSP